MSVLELLFNDAGETTRITTYKLIEGLRNHSAALKKKEKNKQEIEEIVHVPTIISLLLDEDEILYHYSLSRMVYLFVKMFSEPLIPSVSKTPNPVSFAVKLKPTGEQFDISDVLKDDDVQLKRLRDLQYTKNRYVTHIDTCPAVPVVSVMYFTQSAEPAPGSIYFEDGGIVPLQDCINGTNCIACSLDGSPSVPFREFPPEEWTNQYRITKIRPACSTSAFPCVLCQIQSTTVGKSTSLLIKDTTIDPQGSIQPFAVCDVGLNAFNPTMLQYPSTVNTGFLFNHLIYPFPKFPERISFLVNPVTHSLHMDMSDYLPVEGVRQSAPHIHEIPRMWYHSIPTVTLQDFLNANRPAGPIILADGTVTQCILKPCICGDSCVAAMVPLPGTDKGVPLQEFHPSPLWNSQYVETGKRPDDIQTMCILCHLYSYYTKQQLYTLMTINFAGKTTDIDTISQKMDFAPEPRKRKRDGSCAVAKEFIQQLNTLSSSVRTNLSQPFTVSMRGIGSFSNVSTIIPNNIGFKNIKFPFLIVPPKLIRDTVDPYRFDLSFYIPSSSKMEISEPHHYAVAEPIPLFLKPQEDNVQWQVEEELSSSVVVESEDTVMESLMTQCDAIVGMSEDEEDIWQTDVDLNEPRWDDRANNVRKYQQHMIACLTKSKLYPKTNLHVSDDDQSSGKLYTHIVNWLCRHVTLCFKNDSMIKLIISTPLRDCWEYCAFLCTSYLCDQYNVSIPNTLIGKAYAFRISMLLKWIDTIKYTPHSHISYYLHLFLDVHIPGYVQQLENKNAELHNILWPENQIPICEDVICKDLRALLDESNDHFKSKAYKSGIGSILIRSVPTLCGCRNLIQCIDSVLQSNPKARDDIMKIVLCSILGNYKHCKIRAAFTDRVVAYTTIYNTQIFKCGAISKKTHKIISLSLQEHLIFLIRKVTDIYITMCESGKWAMFEIEAVKACDLLLRKANPCLMQSREEDEHIDEDENIYSDGDIKFPNFKQIVFPNFKKMERVWTFMLSRLKMIKPLPLTFDMLENISISTRVKASALQYLGATFMDIMYIHHLFLKYKELAPSKFPCFDPDRLTDVGKIAFKTYMVGRAARAKFVIFPLSSQIRDIQIKTVEQVRGYIDKHVSSCYVCVKCGDVRTGITGIPVSRRSKKPERKKKFTLIIGPDPSIIICGVCGSNDIIPISLIGQMIVIPKNQYGVCTICVDLAVLAKEQPIKGMTFCSRCIKLYTNGTFDDPSWKSREIKTKNVLGISNLFDIPRYRFTICMGCVDPAVIPPKQPIVGMLYCSTCCDIIETRLKALMEHPVCYMGCDSHKAHSKFSMFLHQSTTTCQIYPKYSCDDHVIYPMLCGTPVTDVQLKLAISAFNAYPVSRSIITETDLRRGVRDKYTASNYVNSKIKVPVEGARYLSKEIEKAYKTKFKKRIKLHNNISN